MVSSTALVSVVLVDNKVHVHFDDAPSTPLLSKAYVTTSCEMFSNFLSMDFSNGVKVDTGTFEIQKQYNELDHQFNK